jgi:hypothetical protein
MVVVAELAVVGVFLWGEALMKCPLLMMGKFAGPWPRMKDDYKPGDDSCREEKCAWWDKDSERCAVLMVAVDMDRAVSVVNDLCLTLGAQLGNLNENLIKR